MLDTTRPLPVAVALLLVFAGLPAGIELVGNASAQPSECRERPFAEEGFIAVANPRGDDATVTELYGAAVALGPVPDDEARNGVDAYEIDLGCEVLSHEDPEVCVEAIDGFERDDPTVIPIWSPPEDIERQDFEIKFRDSLYEEVPDTGDGDAEDCTDPKDIPTDTRYVIVYLEDGLPRGVQLAGQTSDVANSGPYTAWFCAKIDGGSCT